jgi:hypothetical protein
MEMNNNIAGINVKLPIYHLHTQGGEDQAQNIEKEVSATDILQELMITSCRSENKIHQVLFITTGRKKKKKKKLDISCHIDKNHSAILFWI